jgi:putative endonuclease
MHYVYILRSLSYRLLYIGYTSNLEQRITQHNEGKSEYTKHRGPWKLVYYESYCSEKDARIREKQLKRFSNAYIQLKRRIKNSIEGL